MKLLGVRRPVHRSNVPDTNTYTHSLSSLPRSAHQCATNVIDSAPRQGNRLDTIVFASPTRLHLSTSTESSGPTEILTFHSNPRLDIKSRGKELGTSVRGTLQATLRGSIILLRDPRRTSCNIRESRARYHISECRCFRLLFHSV